MTPKLTDELRLALEGDPGRPIRVEDEQTQKVYLVMSEEALPTLWEDYIRREVKKGLDDVKAGRTRRYEVVLAHFRDGDAA